MKGVAMMLKALWPDLDWSTPEMLFRNAVPQLDLPLIQRELLAALQRVERMEAQLIALEKRLGGVNNGRSDSAGIDSSYSDAAAAGDAAGGSAAAAAAAGGSAANGSAAGFIGSARED